ncbi:MAG: tyrosine-type recombinase/integrase [Bacteroidetes bacterium]|nr:tyrosine-type recombinase/integrase [Bacteroidota bacterium]
MNISQKRRKMIVGQKNFKMQGTPFFKEQLEKMEEYLIRLGYSEETIKSYIKNLKYFFNWIIKEKVKNLDQTTIDQYLQYLHKKAITSKTIQTKYNVIRHYDKYLEKTKNQKVITKPLYLQDINLPKSSEILTIKEIKKLYDVIEETIIGLRDRALLSLYYGCGLRNREGTMIRLEDIDYKREIIEIKPSKNYQNRFIPLSIKVKEDLYRYQTQSRPYIINKKTSIFLLNNQGKPGTTTTNRRIFNKLAEKAGINKPVTLHMLRHSLGTHLLSQGMQLEQISQLLGHKSLDTTQLYTQIPTKKWKI